jgi:L-fuconolactonase
MIDAHHHLWDLHQTPQRWMVGQQFDPIRQSFNATDYAMASRDCAVAASIVVQTSSSLKETSLLLAIAAADPIVSGVVGWIDLTGPDPDEQIATLRRGNGGHLLVGVRHQVHDEPNPAWLERSDVSAGLDAVKRAGLVFDLLVRPEHLAGAVRVAQRHPGLRFVLDHAAKPDPRSPSREWADGTRALAALPNVWCKVSGLITEAGWDTWTDATVGPALEIVAERFGLDRLMAGSDWPVCTLAGTFADAYQLPARVLGLSGADHAAVFGDVASAVYGLATDGSTRDDA